VSLGKISKLTGWAEFEMFVDLSK